MINLMKFASSLVSLAMLVTACGASPELKDADSQLLSTEASAEHLDEKAHQDPFSSGQVIGAGATALFTCSGHFISGRSLEDIQALELSEVEGEPMEALTFGWSAEINTKGQFVKMESGGGFEPMYAAYTDDLGCTLLPYGQTPYEWNPDDFRLTYDRSDVSPDALFPEGALARTDAATNSDILSVIDAAFDTDRYNPKTRSLGIVVLHKGKLVAERYGQDFGPNTQYRSWSSAKSLTNALIGIAIKQGLIEGLDEKVRVSTWSPEDPRRAITLRNLMHMASGLQTENPNEGNQTFAVYFAGDDLRRRAPVQPLLSEPGTRYHYSNYDTLLLTYHLRQVLGDDEAYREYPYRELFDRIGMQDTYAEMDGFGNYILSSQVYTTPRNLARLGLLYLNDGIWNGERLLPEGWVDFSCKPNGLRDDARYGAHWWIAHLDRLDDGEGLPSVCHADGARGQYVAFIPEHDLVVARMGVDSLNHWEWYFNWELFLADIIKAVEE